jgi:phosphatidylglycerophosphate synthase
MATNGDNAVGVLTAANALTFSRLLLLPVIVVGIAIGPGWLAATGMLVVLLTDLADGRLARRLGQSSAFGKTLDSTIDFVLIYSLFIAFYAAGRLATYEFAILYAAMLTILSVQLSATATGADPASAPMPFGKLTGALQYAFLVFLAAAEVLPETGALARVHAGFFLVLAAAIALNTVWCAAAIARALRGRSAG